MTLTTRTGPGLIATSGSTSNSNPFSRPYETPLAKQYGMPLPLAYGTARVPGRPLWIGTVSTVGDIQIRDTTNSSNGWKSGEGKVAPVLIGLCEGTISNILRAWRWGDCVAALRWLSRPVESGSAITSLYGDGTEGIWALKEGLSTRDDSYPVASEQTTFTAPDVASISSDQGVKRQIGGPGDWEPMTPTTGPLSAGQYAYAAGVYVFAAGDLHPKLVTVRRSLALLPGWIYPMAYQNTAQIRFDALVVSEGSLPDYQFEVIGPCATITDPRLGAATYAVDCHPADVLLDLLTHPRRGLGWPTSQVEVDHGPDGATASSYRTWCTANGFTVSRAIVERVATSQLVEELLDATHARAVWSEGKVKVIPLGETPLGAYAPAAIVAHIGEDDFIVSRGSDPVQVQRLEPSTTFTVHPITFIDRNAHYSSVTVEVPLDDPFVSATAAYSGYEQPAKSRRADARTMDWISTPWHAATISWLLGMRSLYVRNTYRFTLGPRWCRLEPGDLMALTDSALGLAAAQVRITSIEERDSGHLEVYAEEAPFGLSAAPPLLVQENDGLTSQTSAVDQIARGVVPNMQAGDIYGEAVTTVTVTGLAGATASVVGDTVVLTTVPPAMLSGMTSRIAVVVTSWRFAAGFSHLSPGATLKQVDNAGDYSSITFSIYNAAGALVPLTGTWNWGFTVSLQWMFY